MLKAAVDSAETAVNEAQEETTKAIGAEEDDGDGTATRPPPKSVVSSDQEYMLESTAKKARKAGNSVPQVPINLNASNDSILLICMRRIVGWRRSGILMCI